MLNRGRDSMSAVILQQLWCCHTLTLSSRHVVKLNSLLRVFCNRLQPRRRRLLSAFHSQSMWHDTRNRLHSISRVAKASRSFS